MIYDFKMLFEWSSWPETQNYSWYELSKEAGKNIIDNTEISFIESRDLLTPEEKQKMKTDINDENKKWLENLQNQAKDILNAVRDGRYDSPNTIKAIQSLLRIHAINNDLITGNGVIAIDGELSSLKGLFWTETDFKNNYINEIEQLRKITWWEEIVKALNALFWINESSIQIEGNYKAKLQEMQSATEIGKFGELNARMAVDLLSKFINDPDVQRKSIADFYKDQKGSKYAMYVIASVQKLLNLPITGNLDDIPEDAISKFQEDNINDEAFTWMKKVVDWKLWKATLTALVNKHKDIDRPVFQVDDWKLDLNGKWAKESREETEKLKYTKIDMPTNMTEFNNLWEWWDNTFSFYWESGNIVEWKDFVWTDEKGEFIQIGDKKFHIDKTGTGAGTDCIRTKREEHTYEINWEQRTEYVDVVRIGTFNEKWILIDWKEIKSDNGDQQSTEFFDSKKRGEDEEESHFWAVTLWKNPEGSKWRIDLFWADWVDTKRLSEDQLNSLDADDCLRVMKQAIDLYDITKHKPSEVWRYNLNRIVYRILKETEVYDKLAENYWTQFDTPKTASHMLLWMDTWFFTNPDKQLKPKHIENKDEDVMNILGVTTEDLKDSKYKKIEEFTDNTKKWEQIKNRLSILCVFLSKPETQGVIKDKLKNPSN